MKNIKIICDEAVPAIHFLNQTDWDVIETKQENTFAFTRKEKAEDVKEEQ